MTTSRIPHLLLLTLACLSLACVTGSLERNAEKEHEYKSLLTNYSPNLGCPLEGTVLAIGAEREFLACNDFGAMAGWGGFLGTKSEERDATCTYQLPPGWAAVELIPKLCCKPDGAQHSDNGKWKNDANILQGNGRFLSKEQVERHYSDSLNAVGENESGKTKRRLFLDLSEKRDQEVLLLSTYESSHSAVKAYAWAKGWGTGGVDKKRSWTARDWYVRAVCLGTP